MGFITVNNKSVKVNKAELETLLKNATKIKITQDPKQFKSLSNGFFQAEGHFGAHFQSVESYRVKPR